MKEIIERYKSGVKSVIKRITSKYNEDLEQEVFVNVWKNREKYSESGRFRQWINAIAANASRDYMKSKGFKSEQNKADGVFPEDVDAKSFVTPESEFEKFERQKAVSLAISELSPKLRAAIVMYEIDGMSYAQIAEASKCTEGTVKSRLFAARRELFKKLEKYITKGELL